MNEEERGVTGMAVEDQLYQELVEKIKTYHPAKDFDMLEKAYNLAREAHKDQKRKSGEPYIIHPLKVAYILAELELDMESIVAGILHDTIEDTPYTYEDISRIFSEEIAVLVDGVTKLGKLSYSTKEEIQAENYRKMFLAMAKDIRVILIKLADRLHNMRTLNYMTPEKQREKAQETMDIYAPLANKCVKKWKKRASKARSKAAANTFSVFIKRWSTRRKHWIRFMTCLPFVLS